ncbi:MAG: hypothetical protein ACLQQB_10690 [Solirubrobacteraceae bacterium]|jgi:hypothetical protein
MQTNQAPRQSSPRYIAEPWNIEISVRDAREQAGSRHDAQMLTAGAVPADPYTVWLEQREAGEGNGCPRSAHTQRA